MSNSFAMVKLYRMINGYLRYHEAYVKDGLLTERWGMVGEYGDEREEPVSQDHPPIYYVDTALKPVRDRGFIEIPEEEMATLCIEFNLAELEIDEHPLDFRNRLGGKLDNELGWTGLGHWDGGSIGMGTMELFCEVVDYELGLITVETFLEHTEWANYSRIFQMGFDEEPDF